VIFDVMRTSAGASPAGSVPAGTGIFTLLGFCGLYLLVAVLYLVLILRIVAKGPDDLTPPTTSTAGAAQAAAA
jgi:cytochrome d ubiquinol oxidase subunit I